MTDIPAGRSSRRVPFPSFEFLGAEGGEALRVVGVGKGAICPLYIHLPGWVPEPWPWGPMTPLEQRLQMSMFLKQEFPCTLKFMILPARERNHLKFVLLLVILFQSIIFIGTGP